MGSLARVFNLRQTAEAMKNSISIAFQITPPIHCTRRPLTGALLSACAAAIVLAAIFDWLTIKTQRLYLDQSVHSSRQVSGVSQRFVQINDHVMPEIISSGKGRFAFHLSTPHRLFFTAIPEGSCEFEIYLIKDGREQKLLTAKIAKSDSRALLVGPCKGQLEFVTHGKIKWIDLRLSRDFFLWPLYSTGLLLLGTIAWKWRRSVVISVRTANWLTFGVSVLICLTLIELVLRSVALKLPPAILDARHKLGLIVPDPRYGNYQKSARYWMRLRPNIKSYCEWRFGDIAQMGLIPERVAPGVTHRYLVETDAEGFRNAAVRSKIDVAALGDSFTEGGMSPASETWPAQLEKLTGRIVQNYGTAGWGPQQELYALRDYAIKHQPRVTVLAFFAGNDLPDAEEFDHWQRFSDEHGGGEKAGWKITESFQNYETVYIWSILQTGARSILQRNARSAADEAQAPDSAASARFEEGMFSIPVGGKVLHFAWAPWYLPRLAWSRSQFEQSRGWELARTTLVEINRTCAENGGRFVLMFIPSAEQVYWPLAERSFGPAAFQEALAFYMRSWMSVEKIRANRLVQNQMLADFCAKENIPMLDLTPALQQKGESGTAVYFSDDEHWNAAGQEVAASELATFLGRLP